MARECYEVHAASLLCGDDDDRPDSGAPTRWKMVASFAGLEKAAAFAGLMLLGGTAKGVYVYRCEEEDDIEDDAD